MSKLSDALAASRDAFVAMGESEPFSAARARAIAKFYSTNLALARALKGLTVDEAKSTYEEFFGEQTPASFDDVEAGSSSTAEEVQTYENSTAPPRRRRRRARPGRRARERLEEEEIYEILGVR